MMTSIISNNINVLSYRKKTCATKTITVNEKIHTPGLLLPFYRMNYSLA